MISHSSPECITPGDDDPTILEMMRQGAIDDAHASARHLARQFSRLADFLEDLGDIKSDDRGDIEAELLLAKATLIHPHYESFRRAVILVRDLTEVP